MLCSDTKSLIVMDLRTSLPQMDFNEVKSSVKTTPGSDLIEKFLHKFMFACF